MTPAGSLFWIYLSALGFMAGVPALVFGLIARLFGRPFDTTRQFRLFLALLALVALLGLTASILSYNLVSQAGTFSSLKASSLVVGPFVSGLVIFLWASGFPLSRILSRRS